MKESTSTFHKIYISPISKFFLSYIYMMRLLLFKLLDSLYYKHRLNLSLLVDIIFLFSLIATFIECYSKLSFLKKNSVCIFSLFIFISFKGVSFFPYYPAFTTSHHNLGTFFLGFSWHSFRSGSFSFSVRFLMLIYS